MELFFVCEKYIQSYLNMRIIKTNVVEHLMQIEICFSIILLISIQVFDVVFFLIKELCNAREREIKTEEHFKLIGCFLIFLY